MEEAIVCVYFLGGGMTQSSEAGALQSTPTHTGTGVCHTAAVGGGGVVSFGEGVGGLLGASGDEAGRVKHGNVCLCGGRGYTRNRVSWTQAHKADAALAAVCCATDTVPTHTVDAAHTTDTAPTCGPLWVLSAVCACCWCRLSLLLRCCPAGRWGLWICGA